MGSTDEAKARTRARQRRFRVVAIALGLALGWATIELALRLPGIAWPLAFENYVRSCYEDDVATPIRVFDARIGANRPLPHVETICRFNRRLWYHRSDQHGNRNPQDWDRVDVALLGDSMVYGHGVEEPRTFASRLRRRTGRRVANLGLTGSAAPYYLWQVRNVVPRLRPKVVVVFLYRNDLQDERAIRTDAQMARFVASGAGPETTPYRASVEDPTSALLRFASHSWAFRAARYAVREPYSATRRVRDPWDEARVLAYDGALLDAMQARVEAEGGRLVLAFMPTSAPDRMRGARMSRLMRAHVRDAAARLGMPLFDPSAALERPDGSPDLDAYLRGDWHLSAEGHRRIARELAAFLAHEGLLP